jgi:hypothetical protein
VPNVLKFESLKFLESSGPVKAYNGVAITYNTYRKIEDIFVSK